jgi:hypothetical protein
LAADDRQPKPLVQLSVHRSPRASVERDGRKESSGNASHLSLVKVAYRNTREWPL